MQLFKTAGTWVGGLMLMGLGGIWLAMAYFLSGFGQMGPLPTVLGLGVLGGIAVVAGLILCVRGLAATSRPAALPKGSTGWRDDGQRSESDSDFDADAAIARYLQNRPAADSAEAEPVAEVPVRPTFGRKRA
ncbi:MAG TPA: hypothetical protein VF079_02395 [Sphingomicrobium sp.]